MKKQESFWEVKKTLMNIKKLAKITDFYLNKIYIIIIINKIYLKFLIKIGILQNKNLNYY